MKIAKRIFLFLIINFLIISTISFVISIFKLQNFIYSFGINYSSLLIFCLIWGFLGSFISLMLSKKIAKRMMKINIINPYKANENEKEILEIVRKLCNGSGITKMPEVGIYQSKEINAFATGPSKNNSLIAISDGLLNTMNKDELEGVLAHEISHIANGDMVTMTLLQGIVNAFVLFLARVLAYVITKSSGNRNNNFSYFSYILFVYLFQFIFMIFGSLLISFFSRKREYKADFIGVSLAGKNKMIKALMKLQSMQDIKDKKHPKTLNALKISNFSKKGIVIKLFATHPPIEKRIERLKNG